MFLILFSVNIIWLVLTNDLHSWMVLISLQACTLFILNFYYKKNWVFLFLLFLASIFLPFLSVYIYDKFYYSDIPSYDNVYIWTGLIVDTIDSDRFVLIDNESRKYIYYSDYEHSPWDIIYIYSRFDSASNQCNICKSLDSLMDLDFEISFSLTDLIYEYDYQTWLKLRWYYWTLYENNFHFYKKSDLPNLYSSKNWIKSSLIDSLWENKYAGLWIWVLIGDRSLIPSFEYQTFLDTWLVHIIATSWTHVAFLVIFLSFIFFWLPVYLRVFVIIFWISYYAFMVWLSANIFRAWIMWSLTLLAILAGRSVYIRNTIKIAFIIILLISPYSILYDMWFALSFAALIWIVIFQSFLGKSKTLFSSIYSKYLHPTIWASLWVLPFLIFFVDQINFMTLIANFLVLPLLPLLMILSFLLLYFDFQILINLYYLLADWFYFVAKFFYMNWVYLIVYDYLIKVKLILIFIIFVWVFVRLRA